MSPVCRGHAVRHYVVGRRRIIGATYSCRLNRAGPNAGDVAQELGPRGQRLLTRRRFSAVARARGRLSLRIVPLYPFK